MQVYGDEEPSGWLAFAAIVMFSVGFFRIIEAIGDLLIALTDPCRDVDHGGTRNEPSKAEAASSLCASVKTLAGSVTGSRQSRPQLVVHERRQQHPLRRRPHRDDHVGVVPDRRAEGGTFDCRANLRVAARRPWSRPKSTGSTSTAMRSSRAR